MFHVSDLIFDHINRGEKELILDPLTDHGIVGSGAIPFLDLGRFPALKEFIEGTVFIQTDNNDLLSAFGGSHNIIRESEVFTDLIVECSVIFDINDDPFIFEHLPKLLQLITHLIFDGFDDLGFPGGNPDIFIDGPMITEINSDFIHIIDGDLCLSFDQQSTAVHTVSGLGVVVVSPLGCTVFQLVLKQIVEKHSGFLGGDAEIKEAFALGFDLIFIGGGHSADFHNSFSLIYLVVVRYFNITS